MFFSTTLDPLTALADLYERHPSVCREPNDIRRALRQMRGRKSRCHKDCAITIAGVAGMSGVPFGTVAKSESDPDGTSIRTLKNIAKAHGRGVAIIFYDEVR